MTVTKVTRYTCDRCDDTWDNDDKNLERNSFLHWEQVVADSLLPPLIGKYHLCAQCTDDLKEWLQTLPQSEPTKAPDKTCGNCEYMENASVYSGRCRKSSLAVSIDYGCLLFKEREST